MGRPRDVLGARFEAGIVLFLGERDDRYQDRLSAIPLDRLWTSLG